MSADIADRLRTLARDHLEGRLSFETYRKRRAQLLDGLLAPSASPTPDATLPRESTWLDITTQPRTATPRISTDVPKPDPWVLRVGHGRIAALVVLGLALIAAILFLGWHHRSTAVTARGAAAARRGVTSSAGGSDPLRKLLRPLLEDPHWSDARLFAVNEALLEAGPARIAAERQTGWFNAVVDAVRRRLKQQQALAGAPLTPGSSPLAALASTLGIRLTSPNASPGFPRSRIASHAGGRVNSRK